MSTVSVTSAVSTRSMTISVLVVILWLASRLRRSSSSMVMPRRSSTSPTVPAAMEVYTTRPPSLMEMIFGLVTFSSRPDSGMVVSGSASMASAGLILSSSPRRSSTLTAVVVRVSSRPSTTRATCLAVRTVTTDSLVREELGAGETKSCAPSSTPACSKAPSTVPERVVSAICSPLTSMMTSFLAVATVTPPMSRVASIPPVARRKGTDRVPLSWLIRDF